MSDSLVPRDHAEAVALFRTEVVSALARGPLDRGELAAELRKREDDMLDLMLGALRRHGAPEACSRVWRQRSSG